VLATPLPMVQMDIARMVQVVANLLRGSLKYSTRGGRVFVNATESNGSVEMKISYAGQGFSAEKLKSLFAVLRGQEEPHGAQDGLRVTLALAREVVVAHGGEIGVDSRGEDQGGTYWIKLPSVKS